MTVMLSSPCRSDIGGGARPVSSKSGAKPAGAHWSKERPRVRSRVRSRTLVLLTILCLVGFTMANGAMATTWATARVEYYVSLGDSYAAGNQPVASAWDHKDSHGFAYQVVDLAMAKGYQFDLVNFGCGGATTTSVLQQVGCSVDNPGPDTTSYPTQTQAAAASRFISRHRGQIGLVTISIGGNDILACQAAAKLLSCARSVLKVVKRNLTILLASLRHAAGPVCRSSALRTPTSFSARTSPQLRLRRAWLRFRSPNFAAL